MMAQALAHSPPDSGRFGLRIFRGTFASVDDRALFAEIAGQGVDVAIVRTPAGAGGNLQRLGRYGLHPIHADTLVYYQADLAGFSPRAVRNVDVEFSEARAADAGELQALVAQTFADYRSHYHANPLLDRGQILTGYAQWASGYLGQQEGRTTWIARKCGQLVAFACCSHDQVPEECEGVLFGVHPAHAGGGLYGDLIRHAQGRYRQQGYRAMKVSTQIWNLAVQKVWNREGFVLSGACDTFHVNACLSSGELRVERELVFSAEQVARFAEITGDVNPIHLDDAAASRAGFASRLSHGMLAGSELSRIFGTEAPGPGTLFLRCELAFLAPVYADRTHTLRVRYMDFPMRPRQVTAVATIHDQAGTLCLLGYNDLLRR